MFINTLTRDTPKALQITVITLIGGALYIFLQSWVKKLLQWPWIKPTTLDLGSQYGAYNLSAIGYQIGIWKLTCFKNFNFCESWIQYFNKWNRANSS